MEIACVGQGLIVKDNKKRREEVTHSLGVPLAEVGPHKGTDDVSDLRQVSLTLKIPAKEIFQELKFL